MKRAEVKPETFYRNDRGWVYWMGKDSRVHTLFGLSFNLVEVDPSDWQPLLTSSEWQARHPTLRKLGEGEALEVGQEYLRVCDRSRIVCTSTLPTQATGCTYYELPPLPEPEAEREEEAIEEAADAFCARHTAEPERGPLPTPEENPNGFHGRYIIHKVSGEPVDPNALYFVLRLDSEGDDLEHVAACQYAAEAYIDLVLNKPEARHLHQMARELAERIGYEPLVGEPELKHVPFKKVGTKKVLFVEPAPSVVGERLTEPKAGDWIAWFGNGGNHRAPLICKWEHGDFVDEHERVYRYLGEIPTEPPENKTVEPLCPKWKGKVVSKLTGATYWVKRLLRPSEVEFTDSDFTPMACTPQGFVGGYTLITDDPDYPPSPELAQLFAEGGQ